VLFQQIIESLDGDRPQHVAPDADKPPQRYEEEQDWSVMLEVLELVKRTIPTDSDRPAEEVFGVKEGAAGSLCGGVGFQ
jgi:hypothetical protein